jgi:hypothetical protein
MCILKAKAYNAGTLVKGMITFSFLVDFSKEMTGRYRI